MSMYSLVNPAINRLLRSPWHHVLSKRIMSAYFEAVPQDRKFYDGECGADGKPIRSQVEQALGSIVILEFGLQ